MIAAGKGLKPLYPNLFHVTCVAHLLHNCAMHVRAHFPSVDNLVSCVKACVVRNHLRRALFQPLGYPPELIVTRWGSWLEAALYYCKHLPQVRDICEQFQIRWCSCEKRESSCDWWKPNTRSGTNQALLLISCKSPRKGWMFGLYNSRSSC